MMKIKGLYLTVILAAVLCISGNVFAKLSGSGTKTTPYLIQSRANFNEFAANSAYWAIGIYTQLRTNIDLAGTIYTQAVIAPDTNTADDYQGTRYKGKFDGYGFAISNLTIHQPTKSYIGLFGNIMDGEIKNLRLENVSIIGDNLVGGLTGYNRSNIISCSSSGTVTGTGAVGGLVGYHGSGDLSFCYSSCNVEATSMSAGGLVGKYDDGTITSCYATGNVSGVNYVGGFMGRNYGTVIACYATGRVNGTAPDWWTGWYLGGFSGENFGTITNCYAAGLVTANYVGYAGGFVGRNDAGILNACFWDKQISGMGSGVGLGLSAGVVGKMTLEMKTQSTFTTAGWDFSATDGDREDWVMPLGDYPQLNMIVPSSYTPNNQYFVSFEINRENLFPVQDAEYLKTILPWACDLLNEMNARHLQGNENWFDFQIDIESSDEQILSAHFYKPGNPIPVAMKQQNANEFDFCTNEQTPTRVYTSLNELAIDYPSGTYKVEIVFVNGTVIQDVVVPDYNTVTFPGPMDVSVDQDASGQLLLNWNSLSGIDDYEVWAESIKSGKFFDSYDEEVHVSNPQTNQTPMGIYKSKGDYQLGISAEADSYGGNKYWVGFTVGATAFSFKKQPAVKQNQINKCTVTADKGVGIGSISFSGTLDAIEADFTLAMGDIVEVFIDSDLMSRISFQFPVNNATFKKGKYKYSESSKGSTYSFSFDSKTGAMAFSAKNVNLTGLECPIYVSIIIGNTYKAGVQLNEAVVNGTKPCPYQLMMGAKNTLTVKNFKFKPGKTDGTDSFTVQGTFTIDGSADKANPLVITLGTQTFTVPGALFPTGKPGIESCKKADSTGGSIVDAKFDFVKCTYTISVKNTEICNSGNVNFGINCFGVNLQCIDTIVLTVK